MDQSLGSQDAEKDQISWGRAPRSKLTRRTYHGSSASTPRDFDTAYGPAYAPPSDDSRPRMQVCAMMFTEEPQSLSPTLDRAPSSSSVRRSVAGMKNLLPLKLLSPTAPDMDVWPASAPSHRTTFGLRLSLRAEDRRSSVGERTGYYHSTSRPKRYRDTPIYTEPGTPLPSPAYFTDDDVALKFPIIGVASDKAHSINRYSKVKSKHKYGLGDLQETIESICDGNESIIQTALETSSHCSELSFQCSGEDLFSDEAAWLRSPLNITHWPRPSAQPGSDLEAISAGNSVESWLSDTSSYFDQDEDRLACATILTPRKANVVDVSLTPPRFPISIPPRSSSLDNTILFPFMPSHSRDSWFSFVDSPPITPATLVPKSDNPLQDSPFSRDTQSYLPRRRLDLAMTSPPLSPEPANLTPSYTSTPEMMNTQHFDDQSWPLISNTSQETTDEILSSLEECTTNFPSTMLLLDNPCIISIRSKLSRASSQRDKYRRPKTPEHLMAPFPLSSSYSSHRPSGNTMPQPNLQPIRNIFPTSSRTMQAALYAHLLSYIFLTSEDLNSADTSKQGKRKTLHRRSTSSQISPGAADVFEGAFSRDSYISLNTSEFERAKKLQSLQEDVRKCIYCLISVMDETLGMESMMGPDSDDIESSSGMVFLRSLVEVVRTSEERYSEGFY